MNKFTFSLLVLLMVDISNTFSQSFDGPESVEYDTLNHRWLVSQFNGKKVLIYSPASGSLTELATGMTAGPYGIEILGNKLYCCDGSAVKAFDLNTGAAAEVYELGASFLNGITSDGSENLFVTDFSAMKIYRINITTGSFNVMKSVAPSKPNGIIYEGENNRLVFVTWGSVKLVGLSLADSTTTTLLTTSLNNCDGIIRDQQGDYYISTWGNSALSKIESDFSTQPVTVMSGLSSPADLGINAAGDSIGIPNSGTANNVVFYPLPIATGLSHTAVKAIQAFPNPSSGIIYLAFDEAVSNGELLLIDASGKVCLSQPATGYKFSLHTSGLPNGLYTISLRENGKEKGRRKVMVE